jgi:methyl-accepting chemotaxis protein
VKDIVWLRKDEGVMQEMNVQARRKKLYIKPGFQRKMMIIMILLVTIAANLVGGLCFGLISHTLEDELLGATAAQVQMVDSAQAGMLKQGIFEYIFPKILLAELITIALLILLTLRLTHYIAGPVYRLEQNMKEIVRGKLGLRTKLRSKDEFTELADGLNDLVETISQRLDAIDEKITMLECSELTPEQKQVVQSMKTLVLKTPEYREAMGMVDEETEA